MHRIILAVCTLLAGCATGDSSIPRRRIEIVSVTANSAPHASVALAADIEFAFRVNSPLYSTMSVRLPQGRYELRCYDDDGYYFLAVDGRLRITGDGGSKRGGIFVPKESGAIWRVWEVPNYDAAIAIFGPGGAAFGTGRGKAIRHDVIPPEVSGELDAPFRTAIKEANRVAGGN